MNLNHLNLAVSDVAQTRQFFEKYFGFHNLSAASPALAVLRADNGFVLTLSNFDKAEEVIYPEHFHIGFAQDTEEQVNEMHRRLKEDGFAVDAPRKFHGSWTFYFRLPGGPLIEVLC